MGAPPVLFMLSPFIVVLIVALATVVVPVVVVILVVKHLNSRPSQSPGAGSPSRAERTSLLRERRDRYEQERTRILGMVDKGQISAAEAAQLLDSVERETSTMACPFCGEDIRVEALRCLHCGRDLVEEDTRPRRLVRSKDRVLSGVCAGVAEYAGMDTSLVRILVVVAVLMTGIVTGLLIYLVAAIVMPES